MINKSRIEFDQYQRYQTVYRIIEFYRRKLSNKQFSILEIGANQQKRLKLFLPEERILLTDVYLTPEMEADPDFQRVDASSIPFDDKSFDFVVACDVFEHVPKEKREAVLCEMHRVAKYAAILSFPYEAGYILDAEERVNTYYKVCYGSDYRWLTEHAENGLPNIAEVNKMLDNMRIPYAMFYHGDIMIWEKIWYCYFDACMYPQMNPYKSMIDYYYNHNVYEGDTSDQCYRSYYVLTHDSIDELASFTAKMWKECPKNKDHLDLLTQTLNGLKEHCIVQKNKDHLDWQTQTLNGLKEHCIVQKNRIEEIHIAQIEEIKRCNELLTNERNQLLENNNQYKMNMEALRRENEELQQERKQLNNELIAQKNQEEIHIAQIEEIKRCNEELQQERQQLNNELKDLRIQYSEISRSYQTINNAFFWRITAFPRRILDYLKKNA